MQNMRKVSRRKNKRNKTRSMVSLRDQVPDSPPQFDSTLTTGHRFRFVAGSAASQQNITRGNLLNLMFVATSAVAGARIYTAVRLRRISVWSPIVATFTPQTIALEWRGQYASSKIRSDTSQGLQAAKLSSKPPKLSSTGMWTESGQDEAEVLAILTAPTGSVVDVDLTLKFVDIESFTTTGETYVGETLGTVYYNYLDGYTTKVFAASGGVRPVV